MIEIYTDGAYSSNRNKGGWAFVVLADGEKIYSSFFYELDTTSNRMELQASIEAISWCLENKIKNVVIYSDSMYLIGTMTKNWKRNTNNDLWEILDRYSKKLKITWKHVKGHSSNKYNILCDALASQATL